MKRETVTVTVWDHPLIRAGVFHTEMSTTLRTENKVMDSPNADPTKPPVPCPPEYRDGMKLWQTPDLSKGYRFNDRTGLWVLVMEITNEAKRGKAV